MLLVLFLFGIIVGSFLNVLIYRIPLNMSVSKGFSMCTACRHRLYPIDLFPIFSWLFLKGKCRYCAVKISAIYPFVELINAILWVVIGSIYGISLQSGIYCIISSTLLVIAFIDWQHMIIPDRLNIIIAISGIILAITTNNLTILERLIGMVSISGLFLLIVIVSHGHAMGGGDVKLMAAIGICLGWKLTFMATLIGSVGGSVWMLIFMRKKFFQGIEVSYGTFLAVGSIASIMFGNQILSWYIGLIY